MKKTNRQTIVHMTQHRKLNNKQHAMAKNEKDKQTNNSTHDTTYKTKE